MIDKKIKQNIIIIIFTSALFFSPTIAFSDSFSHRIISTNNSPYDISLQYHIRDKSDNLVCVVESKSISYFDSPITREYLNTHPNHKIIEKDDQSINYVLIKDSWRQGEGDSFLSAVKHIVEDHNRGKLFSFFFATTNGCAVQSGDMVTVYWKIFY